MCSSSNFYGCWVSIATCKILQAKADEIAKLMNENEQFQALIEDLKKGMMLDSVELTGSTSWLVVDRFFRCDLHSLGVVKYFWLVWFDVGAAIKFAFVIAQLVYA
ncbi:unnamed protein product [Trifolium pratense]|uniref:Uncharacterized protein n=1 Tax=Trifolium pratense TaxID=57577 RepID=A0ACB0LBD3_TRIPR|nr:unnamed protein product [Trifolium pratense]